MGKTGIDRFLAFVAGGELKALEAAEIEDAWCLLLNEPEISQLVDSSPRNFDGLFIAK